MQVLGRMSGSIPTIAHESRAAENLVFFSALNYCIGVLGLTTSGTSREEPVLIS